MHTLIASAMDLNSFTGTGAFKATLPGAYRVVVSSTNVNPQIKPVTTTDGSVFMTAVFGNAINGTRSSQTALLQIQSRDVWSRYSQIDIAEGSDYFAAFAAASGTALPRLGQDAARLVVTAGTSLTLNATNRFTPDTGGLGGQLDITGTNLVVAASDRLAEFGVTVNGTFTPSNAYAGYLFVDADMLSRLGIESTLIGGYRGNSTEGTKITATALNLEIATDSAHALTGPELLFTSLAPTSANPTSWSRPAATSGRSIPMARVAAISPPSATPPTAPPRLFPRTHPCRRSLRTSRCATASPGASTMPAPSATYGDPATAAASGIDFVSAIVPKIEQLVDRLISRARQSSGDRQSNVAVSLTPAEAVACSMRQCPRSRSTTSSPHLRPRPGLPVSTFNLTPAQFMNLLQQQDALKLDDRSRLPRGAKAGRSRLQQSGKPYAAKYARAYQAISTLFPAALGYTDNSAGGTGAVPRAQTHRRSAHGAFAGRDPRRRRDQSSSAPAATPLCRFELAPTISLPSSRASSRCRAVRCAPTRTAAC